LLPRNIGGEVLYNGAPKAAHGGTQVKKQQENELNPVLTFVLAMIL
jgi:hypothetical protein